MNEESNQVVSDQSEIASKTRGRRRFVRGVGLLAPVVLTMAPRSALANTCLSPSAQASIALDNSRPDRERSACFGLSPGFWKNAAKDNHPNHNLWVASGAEGKYFSSVFFDTSGFPGKTLKDVLNLGGNGSFEALGRHLCAAWCNLQTGKVPPSILSLDTLRKMWAGRNGNYEPVPGVFWNATQIVDYITSATFSG
jgi:hypothetical protein